MGASKPPAADVARSLEGNWRDEHLHELAAALRHFDFLEREIQQLELLIGQEAAKLVWQPEDHDSHLNSGGSSRDVEVATTLS